jgi:hypothetical protein
MQVGAKEVPTLVLEVAYKTQLVKCLVDALRTYNSSLDPSAAAAICGAVSELVLTSSKFMRQFTDAKGIEAMAEMGLFSPPDSVGGDETSAVVSALQIASHLARNSERYYPGLKLCLSPARMIVLLGHADPTVR